MHIVMVRFSSMGDVILQTPLIAWVKENFPECKISFITSKEFSPLVVNHPLIDDVILYEKQKGQKDIQGIYELAQKLNHLKPDFILDLHNTLRAKLLRFLAFKVPSIKVDKRSGKRFLLLKCKWDLLKKESSWHERVIEDFLFLFSGKNYDREVLEKFLRDKTDSQKARLTSIPSSFRKMDLVTEHGISGSYLVISPVASFAAKRWPMDKYQELIEKMLKDKSFIDFKIVLVAGPSDTYCEKLKEISSDRFINLQGKTSLVESTQVIAASSLVITNDTGMGHIAEASAVPVISLFGATSPSFGFRPHLKASKVHYIGVSCSPCSATGSKACSKSEQICMTGISSEDVLLSARDILC